MRYRYFHDTTLGSLWRFDGKKMTVRNGRTKHYKQGWLSSSATPNSFSDDTSEELTPSQAKQLYPNCFK